jgi:signal transduction histidine kinase
LEELDAVRRRVLNVVGHELRTPSSTIRGLAEELTLTSDPARISQDLAPALVRSARRLESLVDDLLVASGISTALPAGRPEPVDLGALTVEFWATLDQAPLPGERDPRAAALIERSAACRIVAAVLSNAHRYGVAPPAVTVRTQAGTLTFAVATPGPPPHPEEVRLAPEPFFRGEHAVTSTPGLGLGLAVARALAQQAGGALTFAADAERGVVTTVELPAA